MWLGANFSLIWAFEQDFVLLENPIDIPSDLSVKVRDILRSAQLLVLALSAIVAPFGIYHALLNAHLTLPVRLLAASENLNKFFYAIVFLIYNFCAFRVGNIKCSQAYFDFAFPLYKKFLPTYLTLDIAQYSQLGISLRRGSVSRAEALLMVQMITNSSIVLANSLFFYSACILINFFFTGNLLLVILELLTLHQFLLYNLLASLISVYCFKKPKEKWEEGERTIVVESYKH
ncbi:unnamed protein product, partial [Mesorhabditis belari]|uniref:Uncharacterized protein n=1 Tax=Mesorhabditis belari TaxID=2138241 RepID=A0AAF3FK33_9BILA